MDWRLGGPPFQEKIRGEGGGGMAKAFGFNDDELKLLLVAVRQMRRTFAAGRKNDPSLEAYALLYDDLFEKLRDMAGPLPENVEEVIE
jgi:hypothetical protein